MSVQLMSGEVFSPSLFEGATIHNLRVILAEYLRVNRDRVILFNQDHNRAEDSAPILGEELYYAFITDPLAYSNISTNLKRDEEGIFRLYYDNDREVVPQELNPDSTLVVTVSRRDLSRVRKLYPISIEDIVIEEDDPYFEEDDYFEEEQKQRIADTNSISLLLSELLYIPNKVKDFYHPQPKVMRMYV